MSSPQMISSPDNTINIEGTSSEATPSPIIVSGKGESFIVDTVVAEPVHEGPTENPLTQTPPSPIPTQDEIDEEAVTALYGSEKAYHKAQTKSTVTELEIQAIRDQFLIPEEYEIRVPVEGEKLYKKPEGKWVAIPIYVLRYGVRFPLHEFIISFLSFVGLGFSQLVPNSYIHLVCFIAFCHQNKIEPALDLLSRFFSLGRSKEAGFRQLNRKPGTKVWMETPTSNKGWHPYWVYMSGGELNILPRWGEPDKKVLEFDKMPSERVNLFNAMHKKMPKSFWPLEHLFSQKWLFDHTCKSFTTSQT